jgi:hypothetical protein
MNSRWRRSPENEFAIWMNNAFTMAQLKRSPEFTFRRFPSLSPPGHPHLPNPVKDAIHPTTWSSLSANRWLVSFAKRNFRGYAIFDSLTLHCVWGGIAHIFKTSLIRFDTTNCCYWIREWLVQWIHCTECEDGFSMMIEPHFIEQWRWKKHSIQSVSQCDSA